MLNDNFAPCCAVQQYLSRDVKRGQMLEAEAIYERKNSQLYTSAVIVTVVV